MDNAPKSTTFTQAKHWLLAERYRVFALIAAVSLVICLLLFAAIPNAAALALLLIVSTALIAASAGLAAGLTWLADRKGETDASDLWDGSQQGDAPASFLPGFDRSSHDSHAR